jgi:hypothetical protein
MLYIVHSSPHTDLNASLDVQRYLVQCSEEQELQVVKSLVYPIPVLQDLDIAMFMRKDLRAHPQRQTVPGKDTTLHVSIASSPVVSVSYGMQQALMAATDAATNIVVYDDEKGALHGSSSDASAAPADAILASGRRQFEGLLALLDGGSIFGGVGGVDVEMCVNIDQLKIHFIDDYTRRLNTAPLMAIQLQRYAVWFLWCIECVCVA